MHYGDYEIRPSVRRDETGRWTGDVILEHLAQDDAEDFTFPLGETYDSRASAEQAAFTLARSVIDGKHPSFRLD